MFAWLKALLVAMYDGIVSFILYCFQFILDVIVLIFSKLWDWILYWFTSLVDFVWSYVQLIYDDGLSFLSQYIGDIIGFLPGSDILAQINYFVPLGEGFLMLVALIYFWLGMLVLKIVLKAIPTIY